MLFMVIENFKGGDASRAGERFKIHGRMLPEDVVYQASWMTADGTRCFQLMEAPDRSRLDAWVERWRDLVEFEIVPVIPSAQFWAGK